MAECSIVMVISVSRIKKFLRTSRCDSTPLAGHTPREEHARRRRAQHGFGNRDGGVGLVPDQYASAPTGAACFEGQGAGGHRLGFQVCEFWRADLRRQVPPSRPFLANCAPNSVTISREEGRSTEGGRIGNCLEGLGCRSVPLEAPSNDLPIDHTGMVCDSGEKNSRSGFQPAMIDVQSLQSVASRLEMECLDSTHDGCPMILASGQGAEQPSLKILDQVNDLFVGEIQIADLRDGPSQGNSEGRRTTQAGTHRRLAYYIHS